MDHRNVEFWQVLVATSLRYFIFAGITYLMFYIWKKKIWFRYKIQQAFPRSKAIQNELLYSGITLLLFALIIYGLLFTSLRGYTRIYANIHERSVTWFFASLLIVIFLHDTYFYWTHRLMHWKKIFSFIHHIHHRSHNPTPLAAFSFHPLEAIIEIGILPLIAFTLPVHRGVIGLFGLYMILLNVIGHLGYELFPKWFLKNKISRWMNTSTHHNMHHHYGKGNYGLYFNFWDRLLKTNHPHYENRFQEIVKNRDHSC
jgi:lathosterol oxidase